jgi:hypothetical protein
MDTTFSLIAEFQYYENYAFTEDGYVDSDNPYWKAKGGHSMIVAEGLSVADVMKLGNAGLKKMVDDACETRDEVQNNGAAQYALIDWVVEEYSEATLQTVLERVKEKEEKAGEWTQDLDYGYFVFGSYEMGLTEPTVHAAMSELYDRGLVWWDKESVYMNAPITTNVVDQKKVA